MRAAVLSLKILAVATVAAGLLAGAASAARAADITVLLDQAKLEKLPEKVSTIVIGNPLIADVSLQPGGLMVLTGKGYGTTNIVALDRTGNVLMEKTIEVQAAQRGIVVVYRGAERESYSCTPVCERRVTLGDSGSYFDATLAQAGTRNQQAVGAAGPNR